MKKLLIVALIAVLSFSFAFSDNVFGLRGGYLPGFSWRIPAGEDKAIEALLTFGGGIIATGTFQWHKPLGDVDGLSWYFGGGIHAGAGFWDQRPIVLGVDGIVGIEYNFEELISIPLIFSLDYKPALDILTGGRGFGPWIDSAFTIRYAF